jgi:hypothetical protein
MRVHSAGTKRLAGLFAVVAVGATAVIAAAQSREMNPANVPFCYAPDECPRTPYDGRFTFVRMYHETRGGFGRRGFGGGGGEPPWHHDRPEAEYNLSAILRELTTLRTFDGVTGGNVFGLSNPEIFQYPAVWVSEPGYWVPSDDEVKNLHDYLLKGGFLIFDDFREDHWPNLVEQMRRVLPDLVPIQLTGEEPIFHSFFDIDPAKLHVEGYGGYQSYWGLFEDNDKTRRQLAIMDRNNDIGEAMEYSGTGFFPIDMSNDAYMLATNYFMYALTH